MTKTTADYPARYYASYDTTATQPTIVTGWYDTGDMGSLDNVPDASNMIPLTEAQWNDPTFRLPVGKGVKGKRVVDYTAPVYVAPLSDQAQTALADARTYVQNNYTMLNEATPDAWVTYLKALMAIDNGTDTKSKTLPSAPSAN
ncbi:hypothetical protein HKD21_11440 [Gluconobacter cerevisiae]|uniref:Uncharacterized protein n=2 Tax=Gluconobacter TaxID=441 RepID=A0ABR9YG61_9PROT|nr:MULTISPECIES: hypothetical protein [Gluconobacter]MBF0877456.1 hypothetical protein [Gluconobacter cerevisiae]GBR32426.1 hypothetical protein AA3266_1076 [Gluconobacter kondonii NBRC 3266]GLQ65215.1 hypothetical protein GCM10007870_07990 [Gluconobacter kondonii]